MIKYKIEPRIGITRTTKTQMSLSLFHLKSLLNISIKAISGNKIINPKKIISFNPKNIDFVFYAVE
jgi:hypothetical protein